MALCLVRRKRKLEGICGLGGHRAKCLAFAYLCPPLDLPFHESLHESVEISFSGNTNLYEFIWIWSE